MVLYDLSSSAMLYSSRWAVLPQVLPSDRPHVDLVLRCLKKIRDAEGSAGAADDAQKAAPASAAAAANGATDPPARAASAGSRPAHVLYDMDADLELALRLSAAEAEAAEWRAVGVGPSEGSPPASHSFLRAAGTNTMMR